MKDQIIIIVGHYRYSSSQTKDLTSCMVSDSYGYTKVQPGIYIGSTSIFLDGTATNADTDIVKATLPLNTSYAVKSTSGLYASVQYTPGLTEISYV